MGLHLISPSQNIIPVAFEIRLANYSCGGSSGFKKIHQIPVLISDKSENLSGELARKILSKAAIYEKETQNKKKRKYNAVNYKD